MQFISLSRDVLVTIWSPKMSAQPLTDARNLATGIAPFSCKTSTAQNSRTARRRRRALLPRPCSHGYRGRSSRQRDQNGRMDRKEAYDVLGLKPGATESEIRSAHRRLMMKLHPDQGGSTYFASRINEAKDALLGRK